MASGWIDASFDLEGHRIGVSVKRLSQDEVARLAARLAWFASIAATPNADLDSTEWPDVLKRIMADYVALTVDDDVAGRLEELWTPLCSGAFRTFIEINRIGSVASQQLLTATCRVS